MAETYVARFPVKWGDPDGNVVLLEPGDTLPSGVSRKDQLDLLMAGSVVPKKVFDALKAADEAEKVAKEAQAAAIAEASNAQLAASTAQQEALLQAHAAVEVAAPTVEPPVGANVPSTTPTVQEVQLAKAAQAPKLATTTKK